MEIVNRFFSEPKSSFFLFGPRGTGKSTWLREKYGKAIFIDLLSPEDYRIYTARPERLRTLVQGNPDVETFVIDVYGEDGLWAVEVKNKQNIHLKDLKGLRTFMEDYPKARPFLLYRGKDKLLVKGIPCIPCSEYLKELRPHQPFDAGAF